jgi:S1-C subfamily serine protease
VVSGCGQALFWPALADYGVATDKLRLTMAGGASYTLPMHSVVLIERQVGQQYQVVTVNDQRLRGYVSAGQVHVVKGRLPEAEEAFEEALSALAANRVGEARLKCLVAAAQAPDYATVYRGLHDQLLAVQEGIDNLQEAKRAARADVGAAKQQVINALRTYNAPKFKDDTGAEARHEVAAVNKVADAQLKVADAQDKLVRASLRLAQLIIQARLFVQNTTLAGNVDVGMRLDEYLVGVVVRHLPDLPYEPMLTPDVLKELLPTEMGVGQLIQAAKSARQERNLHAGIRLLEQAVNQVPTHRRANVMLTTYNRLSEKLGQALEASEKLAGEGRLAEADRLLASARDFCQDLPALNALHEQVRERLAERPEQLRLAAGHEQALRYDQAHAIYKAYGCTEDLARITPLYAQSAEAAGDALTARNLYREAKLDADASRLTPAAEAQQEVYSQARLLLADHRYDQALELIAPFGDRHFRDSIMTQQAAYHEGRGDYEAALTVYRNLSAADQVKRLNALLEKRTQLLASARDMEQAGRLPEALEFYSQANDRRNVRRVAVVLAQAAEKKKKWADAADYYDVADLPQVAGRLRRERKVEVQATAGSGRAMSSEEVFTKCAPATVSIVVPMGGGASLGSGFFISSSGYLLTNSHVLVGRKQAKVMLGNDQTYDATVIQDLPERDLALLKIDKALCPHLPIGRREAIKTGQRVYAIGTPQDLGLAQSFSDGIISGVRKVGPVECYQITVLINQGNSGGPLIDSRGNVIGINSMKLVGDGNVEGINFAILIEEAADLIRQAH